MTQLDAVEELVDNYVPVKVSKKDLAEIFAKNNFGVFAIYRRQLGDESLSDEEVFDRIFGSDFFGDSDTIELGVTDDLVAFSIEVAALAKSDDHRRFMNTLQMMSDEEFEELLVDLPFAAQSRTIFLRRMATSDKYKTIRKYDEDSSPYSLIAKGEGKEYC